MDPVHLKKLVETPVSLTLNAYQFGLLLQWLQVETLERSGELQPLPLDGQAYAQAMQRLQELDGILATIRAAYRQAAQELNIPLDDVRQSGAQPGRMQ
jgi:hypothetical protein